MFEYHTTRLNPQVDPHMHIWGWEIPVYLFLGGMVAGMILISGYFVLGGRFRDRASCAAFRLPMLSLILLTLGMTALFLDLEHKAYFWRLYTTFEIASPMSWGAWILLLVYPAIVALLLLRPAEAWNTRWQRNLQPLLKIAEPWRANPRIVRMIGILNMILGGLLGMYTGVLLSAIGARPLWSSSILWLLFLVSGASSAAALAHMIARDREEREQLAKIDNGFLILELFIITLFLIGLLSTSSVHGEAARLLINGPYAPVFWVFVVGAGILLPLIVQFLAVQHKVAHTPVAPILVIAGGLVLRFVIVYAGQNSHWLAGIQAGIR